MPHCWNCKHNLAAIYRKVLNNGDRRRQEWFVFLRIGATVVVARASRRVLLGRICSHGCHAKLPFYVLLSDCGALSTCRAVFVHFTAEGCGRMRQAANSFRCREGRAQTGGKGSTGNGPTGDNRAPQPVILQLEIRSLFELVQVIRSLPEV